MTWEFQSREKRWNELTTTALILQKTVGGLMLKNRQTTEETTDSFLGMEKKRLWLNGQDAREYMKDAFMTDCFGRAGV